MLHAHDGCSQVNHSKLLVDNLLDADGIVALCIRILGRIAVIDAVDGFCKQNAVCVHLHGPQSDAGIGREIRMSGSSCKEYNLAFLKIAVCLILGKQFCYSAADKRCQNLCLHACIAEDFRNINAVHDGSQHTDLVCFGTLDRVAGTSSPEIASSDDNADLNACINGNFHLSGNLFDCIFVKTGFFRSGKCFTA